MSVIVLNVRTPLIDQNIAQDNLREIILVYLLILLCSFVVHYAAHFTCHLTLKHKFLFK